MTLQPSSAPAAPVPPAAHDRPRPPPLWLAVLLGVLPGVAMLASFPPYGLWWLAPVAVALLAVAVHRRRLRGGVAAGVLTGLLFFVPLLDWTRLAAGWLPWILLASAEAVVFGLLGAAGAWLS